jgi:hypothetical protein
MHNLNRIDEDVGALQLAADPVEDDHTATLECAFGLIELE